MAIELHFIKGYDDVVKIEAGVTAPIFVCDVCRKPIERIGLGVAVWDEPEGTKLGDRIRPLIVHKRTCQRTEIYGCSMELRDVLIYLVNNYGLSLKE